MISVLGKQGYKIIPELDKKHPRDFFRPGRVRVHLLDPETGKAVNQRQTDITTRRQLLKFITAEIKKIPSYEQHINRPPNPIPGIDKDLNTKTSPMDKKRSKRERRHKKKR
jgi:hypothetical protein